MKTALGVLELRCQSPPSSGFPSSPGWTLGKPPGIECCHLLVFAALGNAGFSTGKMRLAPGSALSAGRRAQANLPQEQVWADSYPRITPCKSLRSGFGKAPICDTLDTRNYLHLWNIHSPPLVWVFTHPAQLQSWELLPWNHLEGTIFIVLSK